jgi:hypothetical protein
MYHQELKFNAAIFRREELVKTTERIVLKKKSQGRTIPDTYPIKIEKNHSRQTINPDNSLSQYKS